MAEVWAVDDEASVLFTLREILEEHGHRVRTFARAAEALEALQGAEAELLITDLAMPEMDGLALLSAARRVAPELPVVLLTARGSERVAVRAMKAGAFDYLPKPFELEELEATVARALELGALRRERQRRAVEVGLGRPLIGEAPAFRRVVEAALRVAPRDVPVLIRGETGTGKELIASLVHAASARAHGPLVRFNCAAISEALAESELFGHVRGAFTGATDDHRGYFARAHGGTLVLDEIGELPPRLQPKLLRALQSGELQRVGAGRVETVDVRVVASTHVDLRSAPQFRADLYYRLAVVELRLPTLAERAADIPALARAFARQAAARLGVEGVTLSPRLLAELATRAWPGNVRELENAITRAVALADPEGGGELDALPAEPSASAPPGGTFRERVESLERSLLTEALARADGNQSAAARALGLSRVTFLDKLTRYGLR